MSDSHLFNLLSTDQYPPPLIKRKVLPSNMDQSVLLPCIISQKPLSAKTSVLVVAMATSMMMISGILARRVSKPSKISVPQRISTVPTKPPKNSGDGKPIFSTFRGSHSSFAGSGTEYSPWLEKYKGNRIVQLTTNRKIECSRCYMQAFFNL